MVTRKTAFEGKIRRAVEGNAKLGAEAGKVWDEITAAYRKWKPLDKSYEILEGAAAPGSRLFRMARQIVRDEPLDDSGDPVNETIETMMLTQYLTELTGLGLGEKELPLKSILAGATPAQAAEKMVKASQLKDAAGAQQPGRQSRRRPEIGRSGDRSGASHRCPGAAPAQTA